MEVIQTVRDRFNGSKDKNGELICYTFYYHLVIFLNPTAEVSPFGRTVWNLVKRHKSFNNSKSTLILILILHISETMTGCWNLVKEMKTVVMVGTDATQHRQ